LIYVFKDREEEPINKKLGLIWHKDKLRLVSSSSVCSYNLSKNQSLQINYTQTGDDFQRDLNEF